MDIGAPKSLIGLHQAKLYCKESGINFKPTRSNNNFLFGTHPTRSIGKIKILMPINTKNISITVDVVEENVPLLIGIETMEKYQIQPVVLDGVLESKTDGCKPPLVRKYDHAYLEWRPIINQMFYTRNQLEHLHRHFIHPSAQKIYELLRKASIEDLPSDTLNTLKEISKNCETCSIYRPRQTTFQIRDLDKVQFKPSYNHGYNVPSRQKRKAETSASHNRRCYSI